MNAFNFRSAIAVCALMCAVAFAEDYRFGSEVHVYRRGIWAKGRVMGDGPRSSVQVRLEGQRANVNVLPRDLRPYESRRPEGPAEVGDKVEYFNGRDWATGTIKETGRAFIIVTPEDGGRERRVTANRFLLLADEVEGRGQGAGAGVGGAVGVPGIPQDMLNHMDPRAREAIIRAQQRAQQQLAERGRGNMPGMDRHQKDVGPYKAGDKVDVRTFHGWRVAVVVEPNGMTSKVRYEGETKTETAFASKMRPFIPDRPAGPPQVGDRVEFISIGGDDWQTGVIEEIGFSRTRIKPDYGLPIAEAVETDVRLVPQDYKIDPPPGMADAIAYDLPDAATWSASVAMSVALFAPPEANAPARPLPDPVDAPSRIALQIPENELSMGLRKLDVVPHANRAAVAYSAIVADQTIWVVQVIDLAGEGSTVGTFTAPLGYSFRGISPSGEQLLFAKSDQTRHSHRSPRQGHVQKQGALLVMHIADDKLETTHHGQAADLFNATATFVTDTLVVTSSAQQVMLWDIATGRAVYRLTLSGTRGSMAPHVDAQRGLVTLYDEGRAYILDAVSGKVLFEQVVATLSPPMIALSPDGKRLAVLDNASVRIVNTVERQVESESSHRATLSNPQWLDDRFVMFGSSRAIFDADQGVVVHGYEPLGMQQFTVAGGRGWWAYNGVLLSEVLPSGNTRAAAQRVNLAEAYALRRGDAVSLQVSGESSGTVRQAMENAIAAAGFTIDAGAAVQVVASMSRGKQVTRDYRRGLKEEKITYSPMVHTVQIRTGADVHWARTYTADPGTVMLVSGNQSIQEAVAQNTQAKPDWFNAIRIPSTIAHANYEESIPRTRISP